MVFYKKKTGFRPRNRRRFKRRTNARFRKNSIYQGAFFSSNRFKITRWSVVDTGLFRIADQLTPGGPIVNEWLIDNNGNYKMRFINKNFTLNDLPNFREFSALFNWYSIPAVKVCITFTWENTDTGFTFTEPPPAQPPAGLYAYKPSQNFKVISFIDKTNRIDWGTNNPAYLQNTEEQAKQYASYREHISYNKNFKRMCHPKPLGVLAVNDGGQLGLGGQAVQKWISTANFECPHYGFVTGVRPVFPQQLNVPSKWRVGFSIDTEYTVLFKGTR